MLKWGIIMDYYKFPAIRGIQAKEYYYVCMVGLEFLDKLFVDIDYNASPECRAQRKIDINRIPNISKYILENRNSYVFSSLTGSVDCDAIFEPIIDNIGFLKISQNSKILLNDGQHRKAAIIKALEKDGTLKDESISVVIFVDKGLKRSQQMFSDLNKHAVNTSKSLNVLYDWNNRNAILSKKLVDNIPFFNKYTDKEKDNLGKFSMKIFTLNNIVNANAKIISCNDNDNIIFNFMVNYWSCVIKNIKEFNSLESKIITKKNLRENYILTQGVTLLAFGQLGEFFFKNSGLDMEEYLKGLSSINWLRSNESDWRGCLLKYGGKINRTNDGINLAYIKIKKLIGIKITKQEKQLLKNAMEKIK